MKVFPFKMNNLESRSSITSTFSELTILKMWRVVAVFLVLAILVNVSHQTPKNQDRRERSSIRNKRSTPSCPDGFSQHGDKCYRFFGARFTHARASGICEAHGTFLAEPRSATENQNIRGIMDRRGVNQVWLGASDKHREGDWRWQESGLVLGFKAWGPRQPDNANRREHCLEFKKLQGGWNDAPCEASMQFICQKNTGVQAPSNDYYATCYYGRSDNYTGTVDHTKGGHQCQRWDSQTPHKHPYKTGGQFKDGRLPENYCRNAIGEAYAPWCYTTEPSIRWAYCDVNRCKTHSCPDGFSPHGDKCYRYLDARMTHAGASGACAASGAFLAEPQSGIENQNIRGIIDRRGVNQVWLGATDKRNEGDWRWQTSGWGLGFKAWGRGQPDNGNRREHCLEFKKSQGGWNDAPCEAKMQSICQKNNGASACPDRYIHLGDECYRFVNARMTHAGASDECEADGAFLAEPRTFLEHQYVRGLLESRVEDRVWLGASDKLSEGDWRWQRSGLGLDFKDWGRNQPSNGHGREHCLELWKAFGGWNDAPCDGKKQFFCQKNAGAPSCPVGFTQNGDKCYRYVSNHMTHYDASATCVRDYGAFLAEPQTDRENQHVRAILESLRVDRVWLGATDILSEGNWRWQRSGLGLDFKDWIRNQPSNGNGAEHCLELWKSRGGWNDVPCGVTKPFICQINLGEAPRQPSVGDIYSPPHNKDLHGNWFLITNKKYYYASLRLNFDISRQPHGVNIVYVDVDTREDRTSRDQYWRFMEDRTQKGYFRLYNMRHQDCLLTKNTPWHRACSLYGKHCVAMACRDVQKTNDQLWRFQHVGDGYYLINNFENSANTFLRKWRTQDGYLHLSNQREDIQGMLWKLTPKFEAEITRKEIFRIDNRAGSENIEKILTFTAGSKTTQSTESSLTVGIETSMNFAIGASLDISAEFSSTWTSSTEKSTIREISKPFTIPAGKDFRVSQPITTITDTDSKGGVATVLGSLDIEESNTRLPELHTVKFNWTYCPES